MSPASLRTILVLLIGNLCLIKTIVLSSSIPAGREIETSHSDHLKDTITDLKRFSPIVPSSSLIVGGSKTNKLSDELLQEGASANLGSIFSGIIDQGSSTKESRLKPLYNVATNSRDYLIKSLMEGKRRLDDDTATLASNDRAIRKLNNAQAAKFVEESELANQLHLNAAASRARNQLMMMAAMNNQNQMAAAAANMRRQAAARGQSWAGAKYHQNQMELQQQNRNSNRRSSTGIVDNGENGQFGRGSGNRALMNANNQRDQYQEQQLMRGQRHRQQQHRQESRKRASKPIVNNNKNSDDVSDDEIFNDDDDNDSLSSGSQRKNNDPDEDNSDRRSDDGDSKDDDGEEDDDEPGASSRGRQTSGGSSGKRAGNGGARKGGRGEARKMRAASEQADEDEIREPSSSSESSNEDADEDSDSSNMKQVSLSPKNPQEQAIYSNALVPAKVMVALQGPLDAQVAPTRKEELVSNELSSNEADSVDGSATQLKHSSVELQAAAGHHHGHHGHYYQHVEVPKKKAWKFGFKRGNHKHEIERHEKGHKHKFHSSFKWHAKEKCKKKKKCKSVGKMTWEYKHAKKHHR